MNTHVDQVSDATRKRLHTLREFLIGICRALLLACGTLCLIAGIATGWFAQKTTPPETHPIIWLTLGSLALYQVAKGLR